MGAGRASLGSRVGKPKGRELPNQKAGINSALFAPLAARPSHRSPPKRRGEGGKM